jgi:hypothetical protein
MNANEEIEKELQEQAEARQAQISFNKQAI